MTPASLDELLKEWEANATHNIKWNVAPGSARRILSLIAVVRKQREAMQMGAFHHSACDANWYDDTRTKPDLNGFGEHRLPKACTCAHIKIDEALTEAERILKG